MTLLCGPVKRVNMNILKWLIEVFLILEKGKAKEVEKEFQLRLSCAECHYIKSLTSSSWHSCMRAHTHTQRKGEKTDKKQMSF